MVSKLQKLMRKHLISVKALVKESKLSDGTVRKAIKNPKRVGPESKRMLIRGINKIIWDDGQGPYPMLDATL